MLKTICCIIIMLVVIELGLECRANRRGYDTLVFDTPAPAGAEPGASSDSAFGPTTAFPFRSRIVMPARTAGIARIWLASASYGEDVHVAAPAIFPNVAAGRLHAEVLNASRAGCTITDNSRMIRDLGPTWRPDIAVLYQMSMDIVEIARRLRSGKAADAAVEPAVAPPPGTSARQRPDMLLYQYQHTTIFQIFRECLGGRVNQQRVLADDLGPAAPLLFRRSLEEFITTCRDLGVAPVLCTFAAMSNRDNYRRTPAHALTQLFNIDIGLSLAGWVNAIDEFNDVIRSVARENDLLLIDLAVRFDGRPGCFRDFVHFNRSGHESAGEFLASELDAAAGDAASPGPRHEL